MLAADLINNYAQKKRQNTSSTILCHIVFQRFMQNKTAIWNDMKFQRSRIVCNAKDAKDTRDQAKHIAAVVVCCRASPNRSRSRQSNESAVDSSRTSLSRMIYHR